MTYLILHKSNLIGVSLRNNPTRVSYGLPLLESFKFNKLNAEQKLLLFTLMGLTAKHDNNLPLNEVELNTYGKWNNLNDDIKFLVTMEFYTLSDAPTALVTNGARMSTSLPDNVARLLPAWLNQIAWAEFLEHRRAINKPASEMAITKLLNVLEANQDDQAAIIDNSIQNRWTGLFPLKGGQKNDDVWQSTYDNAFRPTE